jgi:adenylate kinase
VVELKVDEEALLERINNRIRETQARGEPLRADDNPDVLKTRLHAYRTLTAPLIDYYRGRGMLLGVNGMAPVDEVTAAIDEVLALARDPTRTSTKPATPRKAQRKLSKKTAKSRRARAVGVWPPVKKKSARKATKKAGRVVGGRPPTLIAKKRKSKAVGGWAKGGQKARKTAAKRGGRKATPKRRGRR